ncbi:hypothetical protein JXA80_09280 [bacterium]|nr:hypothetical protein [candidate division CSSED10-310 bacterium]
MNHSHQHPFWKWMGILLVIILGLLALKYILFPVIGWLGGILWSVAGFLAVILKFFIFIFLFIAALIGLLMLAAWIIRQFME